tara:strand:+ start:1914 stop:2798 length:885 start_codon:yes stop_codon:yes gene_type:complete
MSHNTHTDSFLNQDQIAYTRDEYLNMAAEWEDPLGLPVIEGHESHSVVRDDLSGMGSKGRFGDLFVRRNPGDFVYIAPRTGIAGISLAQLCNRYGRRLILLCPASARMSNHQLIAHELGAELRFVKIASMTVMKVYGERLAARIGATFIPLGLKHPLVTASIVKTCERITEHYGAPEKVWSAISTGVLQRGLQIGWPDAQFRAVAVSRNIKEGERGIAWLESYPKPFYAPSKCFAPFPSIPTYDLKAWELLQESGEEGCLFWNVAGEVSPQDPTLADRIDSQRGWHDLSDLDID